MDLFTEMGYAKKEKVPAPTDTLETEEEYLKRSNYPKFEVTVKPGDPDYEAASKDSVGYMKNLLEEKPMKPISTVPPTPEVPPTVAKGKGLDLFEEMYGTKEALAQQPVVAKKPVVKESTGEKALRVGEDVARVGGALAGGLVTGTGAMLTHVPYLGYDVVKRLVKGDPLTKAWDEGLLEASNRSLATMGFPAQELLKTEGQKKAVEKVMIPLGAAGAGWRGIAELMTTGSLQKATDVIQGKSEGSSVLVPWAGAIGDTVFMYALGGGGKTAKQWYYKLTVKERALVDAATKETRDAIKASSLTNEKVKELWKNGDRATRDALIRRFAMGEGAGEKLVAKPSAPIKASGATAPRELPAPAGKVHPLEDLMNVLPESEMITPEGAAGKGFTVRPAKPDVIKRPAEGAYTEGEIPAELKVEYTPRISKNGRPYKTEEYAEKVALAKGLSPKSFEIVPVEVEGVRGFGYKRITPLKEVAPESILKTIVRPAAEEGKVELPTGKLEVPAEVELPPKMELSPADQMRYEVLQGTDRALWNAEDKLFMRKLGEATPPVAAPEKLIVSPAEAERLPAPAQLPDVSKIDISTGKIEVPSVVKPSERFVQLAAEKVSYPPEILKEVYEKLLKERPESADALYDAYSNAISAGQKSKGTTTLYTGIDPTQIVPTLKGLAGNIKEAYNYLTELGQKIYSSGKTDFQSWSAEFKTAVGELWDSYKTQATEIWNKLKTGALKPLMNERGSVGYDISGEKVIKQRTMGKMKDGTLLKAPAVTWKEFKLLKSLPDMARKPLGGYTQNPIYAFEDWAARIGPKAQTWVKDKFYYPIREATHRAEQHFKHIFEGTEKFRDALPGNSARNIYLHAISKEVGGAEILKNMGIKEVPQLTPDEVVAYNWMRRGYESLYRQINAARMAAGLKPMNKVENYFTFAADMSIADSLGFSFEKAAKMAAVHPRGTFFRYAIERVGGIQKVHTDAFGIFEKYAKSATRHIYLTPEIAKMREMTGKFHVGEGKSWSMAQEQPRAHKYITDYLDYVAGERKAILPRAIENAMAVLSKNITMFTLAANVRSALIQPTALHNTYIELGPKYLRKGLTDYMIGKSQEALNKSKTLSNREFDIEVKQILEGLSGKATNIKETAGKIGMKPLKFLDMQTATITWLGAFKKAKDFYKLSDERAVQYADDVVVKTQASAAAHDLSPMQRTAVGRFASTFQSFVINNFNFLVKEVAGVKNPQKATPEVAHKVFRYALGATIINSLFDLLGINSPLPSPISAAKRRLDEGGSKKEAAVDATLELVNLVPVIGGVRYGSGVTGASIDYLKDVSAKIGAETGQYKGKTKSWLELGAKGAGIPGGAQVAKTVKILEKGGRVPEAVLGRYPRSSKNALFDMSREFNMERDMKNSLK